MIEVAPLMTTDLWDKPLAWSTDYASVGWISLEPQPLQGGPSLDLQSFWNSFIPRTRKTPKLRGSMRTRPSIQLSVQPTVTEPRKRRKSVSRQPVLSLKDTTSSQLSLAVDETASLQEPVLRSNAPTVSAGTLFSSIASGTGQPYETSLCDLCRQPFEAEEDALLGHLSQHLRELGALRSCETCQIGFAHEGDLKWHLQSTEHRDFKETTRTGFCVRLRKWEQVQLQLHSQTIDKLLQSRSNRPSPRSSSAPPRTRKPFEVEPLLDHRTEDDSETFELPSICAITDTELHTMETKLPQDDSLYSIQQRIQDLTQQFQPNTPNEQPTPYSEFCDSHSLPGSPEQFSKDGLETKADRAMSEPPLRTSRAGDGPTQGAPYYGNSNGSGSGSGGVCTSTSPSQGQKRSSDARDFGHWQEDDDSGNGGLQPKKRKTANGSSPDVEKRFPCIYYIGEPERFKTDVSRHRHISNMCRHLKSHNLYCCSTCITRLRSNEELDSHCGQHVKACTKKGCKRTKPAGHSTDFMDCNHIISGEDQWRELFALQFNRQPPDIFSTASRAPSHAIGSVQSMHETNVSSDPPLRYPLDSTDDSLVDCGLTDSFFEQAMDFDLGLPPNNVQPNGAPMDFGEFLVSTPPQDLQCANETEAGAETTDVGERTMAGEKEQSSIPMQDVAASLQQQLIALESMISTHNKADKDRIYALQEKVVQLEQKLFQSSERERQLEATLEVIFDAFQASGAPQAQPNKPLWNLVKSHSSQVIGSVTSISGQNGGNQGSTSSTSFPQMSPSLTFDTEPKGSARTPPDSAYGSMR